MKQTLETAKLAHFKARVTVLEQQLENAGTAEEFTEIMNSISIAETHIECIESQISAGFRSSAKGELTLPSRILTNH